MRESFLARNCREKDEPHLMDTLHVMHIQKKWRHQLKQKDYIQWKP